MKYPVSSNKNSNIKNCLHIICLLTALFISKKSITAKKAVMLFKYIILKEVILN